jgi:hypothetical protein
MRRAGFVTVLAALGMLVLTTPSGAQAPSVGPGYDVEMSRMIPMLIQI